MFLGRLTEKIVLLTREVIQLTIELKRCRKLISLRKPGLVFLKVVSEGVSGMLRFVVVLPEPGAADVKTGGSRELTVRIGDGESTTVTLAGDAMESGEFSGPDDAPVTGSLVDIDDAGNRSEPRLFEGTVTDTLAPPQPGELALRVTGED